MKRSPEVMATVLDLLRAGLTVESAARACGVSRFAVYTWQRNDPSFALAVGLARRSGAMARARRAKAVVELESQP